MSSSAPRSSWLRGSCCLRPHSSHPWWSELGCSHLWVWQKEPNFGEVQVDSGARAEEDPGCCALAQGRENSIPYVPVRVWGLLCISSALAPSVLLSPGTALVGPVAPPGLIHATPFTLLVSPRELLLTLQDPAQRSFLWPSQAEWYTPPQWPQSIGVCTCVSWLQLDPCTVQSGIQAPELRPPPCSASASFSVTLAHLLTSYTSLFGQIILLSHCNYKGGNGLKEVIIIHLKGIQQLPMLNFHNTFPFRGQHITGIRGYLRFYSVLELQGVFLKYRSLDYIPRRSDSLVWAGLRNMH